MGRIAGRGLRLRVALTTLVGCGQQPATLLGSGPLTPDLARLMAASTRATWHYVIRDPRNDLDAVGPIRVRPSAITTWTSTPPCYDIEVWVTTSRAELTRLAKDPPPGWEQIIATITAHLASHPPGPPQGDPHARLPDARLRRWLAVRDGGCTFPANCPTPPQHTEADHTQEYGKGGPTQDDNLACACVYDHHLRHDHGWNVLQLYPGCIVWISPLGHVYYHRPDDNQ